MSWHVLPMGANTEDHISNYDLLVVYVYRYFVTLSTVFAYFVKASLNEATI